MVVMRMMTMLNDAFDGHMACVLCLSIGYDSEQDGSNSAQAKSPSTSCCTLNLMLPGVRVRI